MGSAASKSNTGNGSCRSSDTNPNGGYPKKAGQYPGLTKGPVLNGLSIGAIVRCVRLVRKMGHKYLSPILRTMPGPAIKYRTQDQFCRVRRNTRFFNNDGVVRRKSHAGHDRHLSSTIVIHKQSGKRSCRVIPAWPDENGFGSLAAALIDRQAFRSAHEIPYSRIVPLDIGAFAIGFVCIGCHFSSPQNSNTFSRCFSRFRPRKGLCQLASKHSSAGTNKPALAHRNHASFIPRKGPSEASPDGAKQRYASLFVGCECRLFASDVGNS